VRLVRAVLLPTLEATGTPTSTPPRSADEAELDYEALLAA
jgi:hypothetical protein